MNTLFITIPECEPIVSTGVKEGDTLIVLQPQITLHAQLKDIPADKQIMVCAPQAWEEMKRIKFAERIQELCQAIIINRNTFSMFTQRWEENAFWNHERFLQADTVASINNPLLPALICGNGPSLDVDWFDGVIYTCWHAAKRLQHANFIGHIDAQGFDFEPPFKPFEGIIATPGVSPKFLESYPDSQLFAYLADNSPIDTRFATKTGHPQQPIINGGVIDMLLNVAILAGHKKIYLSGVDLSFPTKEEAEEYYQETVYEYTNVHGQTVWGDISTNTARRGFTQLAQLNPDIEFIQTSSIGLSIEGFTYVAT